MAKKSVFLLVTLFMTVTALFSQKIVDSVKVYGFPVKEGVIYQYEAKSVYASLNAMPIITVLTKYDTVYHFEEGTITDIQKIDECFAVFLENKKQEIVVYSNLKSIDVKEGQKLKRGSYIGMMEKDYDERMNQVDLLIFQKGKEIPYRKIMDYMRRNISSSPPPSYTL